MYDCIPLNLLTAGQVAQIDELVGCPESVHRLEELGLRRGCLIEMIQPGTPCIVRLAGCKLCFRDNESFSVLVRPGVFA